MSYKSLEAQDFLVSADSITAPCWTGYTPSLTTMYTSSTQIAGTSGNYYINIYNTDPSSDPTAEVQFNIAYGNKYGSGSVAYNSSYTNLSPTRTVYGQWRNLIYGDENTDFTFGRVIPNQQDFYIIAVDRARYKQSLFPGSLNLTLYSGSQTIVLTDNSLDTTTISYCDAGRIYQIVSGSNGSAISNANSAPNAVAAGMTVSGSYGLFLPDVGTIILNASALDLSFANGGIFLNTFRNSNTNNNNPVRLYSTGSGRIGITTGSYTSSFFLNSQETVTSDFVFCRARNAEFNYTENPSFISGSTGAVLYDLFVNNPTTYITTVGMYNDSNELLAVAKLSKPLKKDFTKEALIRVKLDF
jgi:hypothetical protein